MKVNDIARKLDGWTSFRVDRFVDEHWQYEPVFDSNDFPGWVGGIPETDDYSDIGDWDVEEITLDGRHIVVRCYSEEEGGEE